VPHLPLRFEFLYDFMEPPLAVSFTLQCLLGHFIPRREKRTPEFLVQGVQKRFDVDNVIVVVVGGGGGVTPEFLVQGVQKRFDVDNVIVVGVVVVICVVEDLDFIFVVIVVLIHDCLPVV
jgi:hypothetical protein